MNPADRPSSTVATSAPAPAPEDGARGDGSGDPVRAGRLRWRTLLDGILAVLVLLLAVALTLEPITNSDIWAHLAAGRDLAAGMPHASVEAAPSPTWLFDLLCYGVYAILGEAGLGLLRTLVVAAVAAIMLRVGGKGGNVWSAAVFTALALVALAPWLALRPALLSLLYLVLTVGMVEQRVGAAGGTERPSGPAAWISWWPVGVLFVLWVNTDSWFLLGPFVLACYALGGCLPGTGSGTARIPLGVVLGSVVVGVLNPYGYHAIHLPIDMTFPFEMAGEMDEAVVLPWLLSPLARGYWQSGPGGGAAGVATALLTALGLAVLLLPGACLRPPRLLLVASLLGLSFFQARNLPLLTATLGLLAARAVGEATARFAAARPETGLRLRQAITIRYGTVVVGLVLILLAWTDRLHDGVPQPRGWGIELDPGLARVGEAMAARQQAGLLDGYGFHLSAESAHYFAWALPQARAGLTLDPPRTGRSAEFQDVQQALVHGPLNLDWTQTLKRTEIGHIVLVHRDRERTQAVLRRLLTTENGWQLLFHAGRVLVFHWNEPAAGGMTGAASTWRLHARGLYPAEGERAPAAPALPVEASPWEEWLLPEGSTPTLERDAAMVHLLMFEASHPASLQSSSRRWELALAAGALGQLAAADLPGAMLRLDWMEREDQAADPPGVAEAPFLTQLRAGFLRQRDDAPAGLLWAAVRGCRRAIAADPADAAAHLLLGEAYCRLAWNTSERAWAEAFPALHLWRRQQAIGALQQALALRPDLDQAHRWLVALYQELGQTELALRHGLDYQKLQQARGRRRGEWPADFTRRLDGLQKDMVDLGREVAARQDQYQRQQPGRSLTDQARLARSLGLTNTALALLLRPDGAPLPPESLAMVLELLLDTGRHEQGRLWLEPWHQELLGSFDYHWLGARLDAAAGDYSGANENLRGLVVRTAVVLQLGPHPIDLEQALALAVGTAVGAGLRDAAAPQPHWTFAFGGTEPHLRLQQLSGTMRKRTEFLVLQGILALEQGDTIRAQRHLREALAWTRAAPDRPMEPAAGPNLEPIAHHYLGLLEHAERAQAQERRGNPPLRAAVGVRGKTS